MHRITLSCVMLTKRDFDLKPIFAAIIAAPAIAFVGGCSDGGTGGGRICTLIGCQNGLSVRLSQPVRDAGTYVVTLDLDGRAVTCQATLPFASCSTGAGCSAPDVLLEQSGCALPPSGHELTGLQVTSVVRDVRIRIERDGSELVSGNFTPSYTRSEPNGPGCGICEQAGASLNVR
jgi:hypothetical protein